jgi:hypothetical protein
MERAQVIALAVVAAAVALLGIRYLGGGDAAPPPDGVAVRVPAVEGGTGAAPSQPRGRVAPRRAPLALVDQLPEQRDTRRDGAADDEADAGRANGGAEVIGGTRRDPAQLGSSGTGRPGAVGGDGGSANTVASRDGAGASKAAGGGPQPQSGRSSAESPSGDAPPDTAPVLLSLPLKGSVDPEQGGSPTEDGRRGDRRRRGRVHRRRAVHAAGRRPRQRPGRQHRLRHRAALGRQAIRRTTRSCRFATTTPGRTTCRSSRTSTRCVSS